MSGRIVSFPLKVLTAVAGLLVLFLAVGVLLPGTWAAERSAVVEAPPERVFPWVEAPRGWKAWTAWPDVELEALGPARGEGAGVRWDDPSYGDGVFTITASDPPRTVDYAVEVEGGSLSTRGSISLEALDGTTRVTWREEGDFGWNPLMGWAALAMERMQGAELEKGLARLAALAEGDEPPP